MSCWCFTRSRFTADYTLKPPCKTIMWELVPNSKCNFFPSTVEQMRLGGGNKQLKTGRPKVFVTDGTDAALHGLCLIFSRCSPDKAVTEGNISQVRNTRLALPPSMTSYGNKAKSVLLRNAPGEHLMIRTVSEIRSTLQLRPVDPVLID